MYFKDIIGHEDIVSNLINSVASGKISHAYIFEGVDGVGKLKTAKTFGEAILCEEFKGENCGVCKTCHLTSGSTHPDLLEIDLTIGEDGKQKNSISVEAIRQFKKDIHLKPFFAKRKVYILDNAEKMTKEAQNALLKSFEEPPGYVTIILICKGLSKLLSTIQSRAVIIKFNNLKPKELVKYLERHYNEKENKDIYARVGDGSISNMIRLISDEDSLKFRREIIQAVIALISSAVSTSINDLLHIFMTNKDKKYEIIDYTFIFILDLARLKTGNANSVVNIDMTDNLRKIAVNLTIANIYEIENHLASLTEQIGKNANYKLAVINTLIKIWEEIHD